MGTITISSEEAGKTCPYCRFPLKTGGQAERCDACGAVHHEECWEEGGGCAVLGCRNAGAATTRVVPPAPHAATAASAARPVAPFTGSAPTGSSGNRNLVIGIVSGLVIASAGVGAFLALRNTGGNSASPPVTTVQTVQVTTPSTTTTPTTTKTAAAGVSAEERGARTLAAIVRFSEQGRTAVRSGLYDAAIANRQATLVRLQDLVGGTARLQRAKQTFEQAINASLQSDEAYASGGNASASDAQATTFKRLFVSQFNPIATQYGLATFDAGGI